MKALKHRFQSFNLCSFTHACVQRVDLLLRTDAAHDEQFADVRRRQVFLELAHLRVRLLGQLA